MSCRAVPRAQPCLARPRNSRRHGVPGTLGTTSGTPCWPAGRMVSSPHPVLWTGVGKAGRGTRAECVCWELSHLIQKPVAERALLF